jgi:cytidine deaminase
VFPIEDTTVDRLIQSASEVLAQSGDGDKHTVAASIYAADGLIYSGVNLFHFTGGPCAEVVALARLVSDGGAKPVAIVAVADRGRGVVAPCGRCRQVLTDYCPELQVVLMIEGNPSVKALTELLPYTYLRVDRPEVARNI